MEVRVDVHALAARLIGRHANGNVHREDAVPASGLPDSAHACVLFAPSEMMLPKTRSGLSCPFVGVAPTTWSQSTSACPLGNVQGSSVQAELSQATQAKKTIP